MVNIIIYLKIDHNPRDLVTHLLKEKLIASASIDENNIRFKMQNEVLIEEAFNVITSQSKALLFDNIVVEVERKIGEHVAIYSTPIFCSNGFFQDTVKTKTISI